MKLANLAQRSQRKSCFVFPKQHLVFTGPLLFRVVCGLILILSTLTFFSISSASSKAERPPSLSLYPNVEGMVRGGLGGARMVPGKDIWQVSGLAYQVGQTAALSSSRSVGSGRGAVLLPVPLATAAPNLVFLYFLEWSLLVSRVGYSLCLSGRAQRLTPLLCVKEDGSESDSVAATPSSTGSKSNTPTSSVPSASVTPINEGFPPHADFELARPGNRRKSAKRLSRNMEVQVCQETRNVSIGGEGRRW